MGFEEFQGYVNQLRNAGESGVPDTIFDDLTTEYSTLFEGYTENSKEKDAELERLKGEVSRLKSANYDLLTRVSTGNDPDEDVRTDADDVEVTIDSLFKRK